MAAGAHDVAAFSLRGHSAILNFPEILQYLPRPPTTSPNDIKAAASAAGVKNNLILSRSSHEIRNASINPTAEPAYASISSEELRSKQFVISPAFEMVDQLTALKKCENDSTSWLMNIIESGLRNDGIHGQP